MKIPEQAERSVAYVLKFQSPNLTSDALFANRGGGLKTALYRGFRKGLFQFSPELGDDLFVTVRKVSAKQQTSAMFDLSNSSVRQAREAAREIRPRRRRR